MQLKVVLSVSGFSCIHSLRERTSDIRACYISHSYTSTDVELKFCSGFVSSSNANPLALKIVKNDIALGGAALEDTFYSPLNCQLIFSFFHRCMQSTDVDPFLKGHSSTTLHSLPTLTTTILPCRSLSMAFPTRPLRGST